MRDVIKRFPIGALVQVTQGRFKLLPGAVIKHRDEYMSIGVALAGKEDLVWFAADELERVDTSAYEPKTAVTVDIPGGDHLIFSTSSSKVFTLTADRPVDRMEFTDRERQILCGLLALVHERLDAIEATP